MISGRCAGLSRPVQCPAGAALPLGAPLASVGPCAASGVGASPLAAAPVVEQSCLESFVGVNCKNAQVTCLVTSVETASMSFLYIIIQINSETY